MERNASKAVGWARDLSGRRVDFKFKTGISWGVEVDFSIGSDQKEHIKDVSRVRIPSSINSIRFLDLNPQESIPPKDRNISSDHVNWKTTPLSILTRSTVAKKTIFTSWGEREADMKRTEGLGDLFEDFFASDKLGAAQFSRTLLHSRAPKLLIVMGHGDDDPWTIGEQYSQEPTFSKWKQKLGNSVPVKTLLKRYDSPGEYAAIMLFVCYTGTRGIRPLNVPIVYPEGTVGGYPRPASVTVALP